MKPRTFHVKLNEGTHKRLALRAILDGKTRHEVALRALESWLSWRENAENTRSDKHE